MRAATWTACLLLVGLSSFFAMLWSNEAVVLLLLAVPLILWINFRKVFNSLFLSPTAIVAGVIYLVATAGYLLRDVLDTTAGEGASIDIYLSEKESFETLFLMVGLSNILILTSAAFIQIRGKEPQIKLAEKRKRKRDISNWVIMAVAVPSIIVILDNGKSLLVRDDYLFIKSGSIFGSLSGPLIIGSILGCGYIFGASRGLHRLLALFILTVDILLFISFGSRQFALFPTLFAVGILVANNSRPARVGVFLAAGLSFLLLPFPLRFRAASQHGLIPHLQVFFEGDQNSTSWISALNNVLVSFDITGMTAARGIFTWEHLYISLNPLPGQLAGWYSVTNILRLNTVTPEGAIGELGSIGPEALILVGIIFGIALAWLELVVHNRLIARSNIYVAAIIGMVALFALNLLQYPLRSASRLLLYALVLEVARRIWMTFRPNGARIEPSRRPPSKSATPTYPLIVEHTQSREVSKSGESGNSV